jgi:outer membrane lipoprotein carrier protein
MSGARLAALIAVLAAAIVTPSPLGAASKEPARSSAQLNLLLDRLQKHYQQTSCFSAKFTEEIIPAGGAKRERSGIVFYRKPGKMRWEFEGQDQELIVSDGKQLYNYQPDLNQVIETPVEQAFKSSSTAAFLLGIGNVKRDFDASMPANPPADGLKHIALKPKNGSDSFEMGVDPTTLDLRSLRLTDALGDVTQLALSDIKQGATLDDKLFTFIAPAGADIVKAPQQPNSH